MKLPVKVFIVLLAVWIGASFLILRSCHAQAPSISTPGQLIAYFKGIAGTSFLSGQFTGSPAQGGSFGGIGPINTIQANTGEWLGVLGVDPWEAPGTTFDSTLTNYAIPYWKAGGLIEITPSMPNPTTGGGVGDVSSLNTTDLLSNGTTTNTNFVNNLASLATLIQTFASSGVVVILDPFKENNGNYFWFGTNTAGLAGPAGLMTSTQFKSMWQYAWNYLTVTKGLTNIVWLYHINATGSGGSGDTSDYPGNSYADLTGFSIYSNTPGSAAQSDYTSLIALGKPVVMAEFGFNSPSIGDASQLETTLITQIQTYTPNIVYWLQWWSANGSSAGWGMDTITSTASVTSALSNAQVINRGQIIYHGIVTWNPGDVSAGITLSNSNQTATSTAGAADNTTRANFSRSTGSYCFQITATTLTTNFNVGVANSLYPLTGSTMGFTTRSVGFYPQGGGGGNKQGSVFNGALLGATGSTTDANGDTIMVCVNLTSSQIWVRTNAMVTAGNTWNNSASANPATATGGNSISGLTCPCYPAFNEEDSGGVAVLNTTGPFMTALPAGFVAWQPAITGSGPIIINRNDQALPRYAILEPWQE